MNLYPSFYRQVREVSVASFPSLKEIPEPTWDRLLSPYVIDLPKKAWTEVEKAVDAFYSLSRRPSYREKLSYETSPAFSQGSNASVLMAYDFHTSADGQPHLVEINTNASSYLLGTILDSVHGEVDLLSSSLVEELKRSFLAEMVGLKRQNIAIVDDDVRAQKMYLEFLMYRDLFRHWGWQAEIGDASQLKLSQTLKLDKFDVDFVYNRSTDFYLTEDSHHDLHSAWQKDISRVSPQPREYFLLADKSRMIDFAKVDWLKSAGATDSEISAIQSVITPTFEKSAFGSHEQLWAQRKNLFFKPKHSFGGKSAYRGESVSRKVFDRLMHDDDILIQKFVPAAPFPVQDPQDPMSHWKFDVRFYVYRDRIQQAVARLYQGQVTNFASPLGGFAKVRFV